jgi:hypothetical protein
LNVIFYSGDPRFVSRSGIQPAGKRHRKGRENRYEDKKAKLPVHAFWSKRPNSGGLFGA